jgi:pentatricopeptide repeat protein
LFTLYQGRLKDALKYLDEMKKIPISPNDIIYGALLDIFAKLGDMESVMKYWQEMLSMSIRPNVAVSLAFHSLMTRNSTTIQL